MARTARKRVISPYGKEIKVNLPTEVLKAVTAGSTSVDITKLGPRQP